jgi:prepilin-type N-terminal cleavage/methylation domain-containing protein
MVRKIISPKAFSLVELSVVILITSILITGAITVSKTGIRKANIQTTQDKMAEINRALTRFVALNRRLPCPADITKYSTSSGFGAEVGTAGTCGGTGTRTTNPIVSNQVGLFAYGMVPVNALELPNDMAQDGFGTKFYYVVDASSTATTPLPLDPGGIYTGFEATPSTAQGSYTGNTGYFGDPLKIYITDYGLTTSTAALFVLISNGPNKFGGFNFNSANSNIAPTSTDELKNIYGADGYIFANTSTDKIFDDILLFRTKSQIIYDAGMQFIICSGNPGSGGWGNSGESLYNSAYWRSTFYGNAPVAVTNCASTRYCGPYGIWAKPYPDC